MRRSRALAMLGIVILGLYLGSVTGLYPRLRQAAAAAVEAGRMKNVTLPRRLASRPALPVTPEDEPEKPEAVSAAAQVLRAPASEREPPVTPPPTPELEEVLSTTIQGGLSIKNETGYEVDAAQLMRQGAALRLPAEGPQVLIIHTHGSEAYTQAGLDRYEANDNKRTEDTRYNIVRVGDELESLLRQAGLGVIHDREIYDFPSYTGSYARSGQAVARYLEENPSLQVVLDIHRDALGANGVVYKTMAEEEGVVASQIMILVGSSASGLEHPDWQTNLSLALYLQESIGRVHPTLMRPVSLVPERYNQHLAPGALILEVGSSGNTLQEALAAIRLFADAAAPALLDLVER